MTRDDVAEAAALVVQRLGDKAAEDPWSTGLQVADELGFTEDDVPSHDSPPIDYGVWIDDPPRLALQRWYLDRLRSLPLSHVSVMVDGPRPGMSDARWSEDELAELASALPDVRRGVTLWAAAQRDAVQELATSLHTAVVALGASSVEVDAEPVGGWASGRVQGYSGGLLEASRDLAAHMISAGVDVEVTVFPGALRHVTELLGALAEHRRPRLYLQSYAVRHRGEDRVSWTGPLGPLRLPSESIEAASAAMPRVEVCYGRAVYDTEWPGGKDSILPGTIAALGAGARSVRDWSSKWLCRKRGHAGRRETVSRVHERAVELVGAG